MSKIDPRLQFLQQEPQPVLSALEATGRFGLESAATAAPQVKVLIRHRGSVAELERNGLAVRTVAGDVVSGLIALDRIDSLAALPDVIHIEGARPLVSELEVSRKEVRADLVHTGALPTIPAYRGAGVIVGIIDTGIDFTHPCFRKADGTSRILAIWDQSLEPTAGETAPEPYEYGVEYTKANIDAALASGQPYTVVRHRDNSFASFHGTHVAGIAAGDGSAPGNGQPASTFVGMAPEADLIVVANQIGAATLGDSANTIDAISYIFDKATALGKAVVINQSQGMNLGAHDGSSLLERGIDNLLGNPGRSMVKSAGNEGNLGRHASGLVPLKGSVSVQFGVDNSDSTPNVIEIWYSGSDRFQFTITPPGGSASAVVNPGDAPTTLTLPNGNQVYIASVVQDPRNQDNLIYVQQVQGSAAAIQAGVWAFTLTGVTATNGRFDAWIERGLPWNTPEFRPPHRDDSRTLSIPGTAKEVIAVASYVVKSPTSGIGNISNFSSRGPTRDGRLKPEVAAPGEQIMAALAESGSTATPYQLLQGTSMAAPHVAGVIALMLQRNPSLTQTQLIDGLTKTARRDGFTGPDPNPTWGYGKLDAKAAVDWVTLPQLRPIVIYEYSARDLRSGWRFFYTKETNVTAGWARTNRQFLAFGEKAEGNVPVYRFSADGPWRFQYSRSQTAAGPGWHNDGIAFYAYASGGVDRRPIYQYSPQNPSTQSPWRFRYSLEPQLADPGWRNDGIVFYVPSNR